jgi:hypothetical protein
MQLFVSQNRRFQACLLILIAAIYSGQSEAVVPVEGMYYKPDEPGTGFVLEYQAGVVVVTYFAYEEDGRPVWWQMSGELKEAIVVPGFSEPPPPAGAGKEIHFIEGNLQRFEGGSCLGCDYKAPEVVSSPSFIRIFFRESTQATFFLGEGFNNTELYVHLEFGFVQFIRNFERDDSPLIYETTGFPDLRGEWTFVTEAGVNGPWRFEFTSVDVQEFEENDNYRVTFDTNDPDIFMQCIPVEDQETAAGCQMHAGDKVLFSAILSDIGAERIYAFRGRLGGSLGSDDPGPLRREHKVWGFRLIERPVSE